MVAIRFIMVINSEMKVKGCGQARYASEVDKLRNNTRQSLRKGSIKYYVL